MIDGINPFHGMDLTAFVRREISGWRVTEVAWLFFCQAAVVSLSLYWGDGALGILAATTGMMYTVLSGKGKVSCYLFGAVNAPLYAWLSWKHGYYGDMALNLYYFVMMFPGFLSWSRNYGAENGSSVVKRALPARTRLFCFAVLISASALLWLFLSAIGGTRPLCDALTNVLSIAAMVLALKRCIEQWILWIAVDAIEIFMWWGTRHDGAEVSVLLMWTLFLLNGIYLLCLWMRRE